MDCLGKVPDEIDRESAMKKVVLRRLEPGREVNWAAVEAGKSENVKVGISTGAAK